MEAIHPMTGISYAPQHWPVKLAEYHKDRVCESSTTLKRFVENRWQYYCERVLGQQGEAVELDSSEALSLGQAMHAILDDPIAARDEIMVCPQGRKSAAFKTCAFVNRHKICVTQDEHDRAWAMAEAVRTNRQVRDLLDGVHFDREHAVRWLDAETDLPLKVCFDVLRADGACFCFKSAGNPMPHGYRNFVSNMGELGYYRSAALQCDARDLYRSYLGEGTGFTWIVVGSEAPHEVLVYKLTQPTLELGRAHNKQILAALKACRDFSDESNPTAWKNPYHCTPLELDVEPWAFRKELPL